MSRLHNLKQRRQDLSEIREIMNSMKTLAYLETRKLARFLDAQHAVVESIEDMAADLLSFHPELRTETEPMASVFLLIGTERGFCGDFNHALVKHLETVLRSHPVEKPILVSIGRKLNILLERDQRSVAALDGASVVEEVTDLLAEVAKQLVTLQTRYGSLALFCLYHSEEGVIEVKRLLPPFQDLLRKPPGLPHAALLNLPRQVFLAELTENYLFAALHEILYTSLSAENHHRVTHLEGAVKHLDDQAGELVRQSNVLRQEEIIEEIEVILLSAGSLWTGPTKREQVPTDT